MFDFFASERQYVDHLLPLWYALAPEERGKFFCLSYNVDYVLKRVPGESVEVGRAPITTDPMVVASFSDLVYNEQRRIVFVEHGAGQTYLDEHPSYAGGERRDAVRLFLCPNERVAELNRARYPQAATAVVGSPRIDTLRGIAYRGSGQMAPTVAISFHWNCTLCPESRWAFPHYGTKTLAQLQQHFNVIGHAHPRVWSILEHEYETVGIEPVRHFEEVVERADVYVCDNSSTIFEFAALDRPVVLLNAPWYRRDVEHGLRFWNDASVGIQVDDPEQLIEGIELALTDDPHHRLRRRETIARIYNSSQPATARAIAAMREVFRERAA